MLRKRLFLIEKLKDSENVGLVVGTLAVKGFKKAIERIRKLCKTANKRLYVFSVGKVCFQFKKIIIEFIRLMMQN